MIQKYKKKIIKSSNKTKINQLNKLNKNELNFQKYKNWFWNYGSNGGINLFLTIFGKRKGCNIVLKNIKNKSKFEKILNEYNMHYLSFFDNNRIEYFISKNKFNFDKIKYEHNKHPKYHKYIGKFLEYPTFFNVRNDCDKKNTYGFRFELFRKGNQKILETIFGFRCYEKDFNLNLIKKMKKKRLIFEKTIINELPNLFPKIDVQLNIRVR